MIVKKQHGPGVEIRARAHVSQSTGAAPTCVLSALFSASYCTAADMARTWPWCVHCEVAVKFEDTATLGNEGERAGLGACRLESRDFRSGFGRPGMVAFRPTSRGFSCSALLRPTRPKFVDRERQRDASKADKREMRDPAAAKVDVVGPRGRMREPGPYSMTPYAASKEGRQGRAQHIGAAAG